jgi:hypothetical protein
MAADTQADNLDGPGSVVSHRPQKNRLRTVPTASGHGSTSVVRKGTGPRTKQGKERSKHNAVTHGIFSKVVVLKGESQAEFDALLNRLRNDRQPVGTLEELLVEKLATLFWRNRRLLIAEGAEIRAGSEFVDWDGQERQRQEFAGLPPGLLFNNGLMLCIANPHAVQGCLSFLEELEGGIVARGFAPELDAVILTKLYGRDHQENGKPTLFGSYLRCAGLATCPEEGRKEKGLPSNQRVKEIFLAELRKVVAWLGCHEKELARNLARKSELESLRQKVPDAPQVDRLLRYETSLERSIERTLNQLERLQRMRLGRPVPPPISLNINS